MRAKINKYKKQQLNLRTNEQVNMYICGRNWNSVYGL